MRLPLHLNRGFVVLAEKETNETGHHRIIATIRPFSLMNSSPVYRLFTQWMITNRSNATTSEESISLLHSHTNFVFTSAHYSNRIKLLIPMVKHDAHCAIERHLHFLCKRSSKK